MLHQIALSKLTYCSYLDDTDSRYDAIVHSVDEITLEKIASMTPIDRPLIFRVMTREHTPLHEGTRRGRANHNHITTNFHPFKHYTEDKVEVLRSHWIGGIQNGYFCDDHGKLTNDLGKMLMLLTNKYANRSNYRSYSYRDEMICEAVVHLCKIALQFDESKSDNPFAFFTTSIRNVFTKVLNTEKKIRDYRDDCMIEAGITPSYTRQGERDLDIDK